MCRSYPIWNEIDSCAYKSGKSYGVKETGEVKVKVGTSAKNYFDFLSHCVTKRIEGDYTVFRFSVDGVVIKTGWLHKKKGSTPVFEKPTELCAKQ